MNDTPLDYKTQLGAAQLELQQRVSDPAWIGIQILGQGHYFADPVEVTLCDLPAPAPHRLRFAGPDLLAAVTGALTYLREVG